jgi:glycosyltransferase involved in cell wall biosynthesis
MIAYTDYSVDARVRREAETLAAHGFHVRCLTTRLGASPATFVLNGVEVRELGVPKYRGKSTRAYLASYVKFVVRASAACVQLMVKGELDVVHVHNIPDFLVAAGVLPRLLGRRVVLDVHDSVPETFAAKFAGGPLFRKLLFMEERLSAAVAHRVICVNHPQRDTLVARGIPSVKTFISMNVPDQSIFKQPSSRIRTAPRETFDLVYHGTMAERLGVDLIIKAVVGLGERVPRLRLHLWGSGDDLPLFQRLAQQLRAGDRVEFIPQGYPLSQLPEHLCSMDLGIVGNRRNAACDLMLPVKLLEYVALGIPAVTPRLKTIERYFADDMVTYYEPEDVASMADAIERLFRDPQARRRQTERAAAFLQEYGWERQGRDLVTFYRTLVES